MHLSFITVSMRDDQNRPLDNNGIPWSIAIVIRMVEIPIAPSTAKKLPKKEKRKGIKLVKRKPTVIKDTTTTEKPKDTTKQDGVLEKPVEKSKE